LQKYIEDPLSESLIQGTLPRPSELEVYLGDTGIYYRQLAGEAEPAAVTAGGPAEPVPGTLLYTF
jgi:ATP-dependent Clp protease ATP-binding subunit ClpC